MKFEDKFPDALPGTPITGNIVKALHEHQMRPCVVCGEATRWFHRMMIKHVCSEECEASYQASMN